MKTEFVTDLPTNVRASMGALLNERLADALDLKLAVKQAHWNIRGKGFIAVHLLLDGVAAHMDAHADVLAERAVQLGNRAVGTVQAVVKATALAPYPTETTDIGEHLLALRDRLATFTAGCRVSIDEALEADDAATADIFTEVSRAVDKDLWMVAANLD